MILRLRSLNRSEKLYKTVFNSSSFSSLTRRSLKTYPNTTDSSKSNTVVDSIEVVAFSQKTGANSQKDFLVECMRNNDSDGAMNLIDALISNDDIVNMKAFHPLLCLCSKREHIRRALCMLERLKTVNISPSEQVFVALIRCYCDDNAITEALKLVDTMLNSSMVPKLRALQPILESACKTNDVQHVIFIMQFMQQLNIEFQTGPLTLFLEVVGRNYHVLSEKQHQAVNDLLHHAGDKLLGLVMTDMQRVVASFEGVSVDQVQRDGVLVESLDDIRGAIVDASALDVDGSVLAVDISFDGSVSQVIRALPRLTNVDPSIPIGQHSEYQLDGSSAEGVVRECAPPQKFVIRPVLGRSASSEDIIAENAFSESAARIVQVSTTQCRCPNCLTVLEPSFVTEADRVQVRAALRNVSKPLNAQLDAFSAWLCRQEEFEYIVDGPNVAYHNQNFRNGSGKFSFQQIELVVNKLRERGKRILVVIPHHYTLSTIPNSVCGERRRDVMTDADKAVLQRLRDDNMLYVVPSGANDDWYWIYATLYKGRKGPAYVVTNDLMRDHKVAFPEARTFMRWRTSQVVYFGLSSAVTADESSSEGRDEQLHDDLSDLYGEDVPEAFLYGPGDFSREMQHSAVTDRWHIPAVDRSHWLCLKHNDARK